MSDQADARLAAIERRLERGAGAMPSPALRRRVLGAVDDALAAPPPRLRRVAEGEGATWAWTAAVACGGLVAVTVLAAVTPAPRLERPSLVTRLRTAGVDDADLLQLVAVPPAAAAAPLGRSTVSAASDPPALRAIDARRLVTENF